MNLACLFGRHRPSLGSIARRPGRYVAICEECARPLEKAYDWYSFSVLPRLGRLVARDEASYRYLAESIRMHPDQ